jgi:signal transduction histidine kinase
VPAFVIIAAMSLRQRLNPRLHFAAAIGWAVFIVVTLAALVTANLAASEAERRARADADGRLDEFATQLRDALSMQLETRRSLLQAKAAQVVADGDRGTAALRRDLDAMRETFPELTWLAVVDGGGRLRAATDASAPGSDLSSETWFAAARANTYVSDRPALPGAVGARHVDIAMPLDARLPGSGVLAARLDWTWVEQLLARMGGALDGQRRLEVLLTSRDGIVLAGPDGWPGRHLDAGRDATDAGRYVAGSRTSLRLADGLGLGWTAIVRQQAEMALAPVVTTRRTVFLTVFLAGLLSAAAAAAVTRVLTRRLTLLAREAEAVRRGDKATMTPPAGSDEVQRIGATLAELVDHLQREKQALQALNVELDSRVAERTQRIERMADEARHAAVTRERLRIARDLHDTLAHSLMALLTQVRLVRKLRRRMGDEELDAELARAEEVATSGLAGARSAIAQMRGNGTREAGLGPALQDLTRRFGERTGLTVVLETDPEAAAWAGERSETVFRIVEEALRNVERHADPQRVQVRLLRDAGGLRVEVVDDGIGFEPSLPRPGHYGLLGIQEQAALIEARLGVHSRPGAGTRIELRFAP